MNQENDISVMGKALKALPSTKLKDPRQQRHFLALAVFLVNSGLFHLAKQYQEALRVAKKLAEDEKPETSTITLSLKVNFTNLDHLSAELKASSKALKLQSKSEISDDISQLQLDFNGKDIVGMSGEATAAGDPEDDDESEDEDSDESEEESEEDPSNEIPNVEGEEHDAPVEGSGVAMEDLALPELKAKAKALGIVGYGKAKRADLIEMIKTAEAEDQAEHANVVKMPAHAA